MEEGPDLDLGNSHQTPSRGCEMDARVLVPRAAATAASPRCHLQAFWLCPSFLHSQTAGLWKTTRGWETHPSLQELEGLGAALELFQGVCSTPRASSVACPFLSHRRVWKLCVSLPASEKGGGCPCVGAQGARRSGMCPGTTWGSFPRGWVWGRSGRGPQEVRGARSPPLGVAFPVTARERSRGHGGDDGMERTRPWGIPALPLPALTLGIVS